MEAEKYINTHDSPSLVKSPHATLHTRDRIHPVYQNESGIDNRTCGSNYLQAILIFSFAVLAVAVHDNSFRPVAKRAYGTELYRRQFAGCAAQCASIESALACNSTECACPILNSAGSAAVNACVTCVDPVSPLTASNITLFANVCSMCESQCSTSLTAYIQTLSCNSTICECSIYLGVGAGPLTTCANCVQTFSPAIADGLLEFAQACGLNVTVPSPPPSSATSASASASASTVSTPSSSSASSTPSAATTAHSLGCRVGFEFFGKLAAITLGCSVFTFMVV